MLLAVDVTELMVLASPDADADVEGAAGRDSTTNSRHRDTDHVLESNVGRWLGHEHEALVEQVEETLARLDRALDTELLMMTGQSQRGGLMRVATHGIKDGPEKVFGWREDLPPRQTTEDLRNHGMERIFVLRL